jgi:hypothetical protein
MVTSGSSGATNGSGNVARRLFVPSLWLACLASCSGGESPDATRSTEAAISDPFPDDAFRAASGCSDCTVLNKARLNLPETGVRAASAHLLRPSGQILTQTIDAAGNGVDETALIAAERTTTISRYGVFTKELHQALLTLGDDERIWIWVWGAVPNDSVRRDQLIASPSLAATHRQQVAASLNAAATPIRALLGAHRADIAEDGSGSPYIRANVPVRAVKLLARLPQVGAVGLSAASYVYDTSYSWYGTIQADAAHMYSTGAGVGICLLDEGRPRDFEMPRLSVTIQDPSSPITSGHTSEMAGIIKSLDWPVNCMAPDATVYVANGDRAELWCQSHTTLVMDFNRRLNSNESTVIPCADDWKKDWLALQYPYPVIVATSGNYDPLNDPFPMNVVMNRFYNGLVVGASYDRETPARIDNVTCPSASWTNFQTNHNDFELPNLVATGSGVEAVGRPGPDWTSCSTCPAASQVAGIAALVIARDLATFAEWPEMSRAVLLASATGRLDASDLANLPATWDQHVGAGEASASKAVNLARPDCWFAGDGLNKLFARSGRIVEPVDFDANGVLKNTFTTGPMLTSGRRLRAVITWDAIPAGCNSNGDNCTGSTLYDDLNLQVLDNGVVAVSSTSFDSSWEMVDIPVTLGHDYTLRVLKGTANWYTYLGIAWLVYPAGSR